MILTRDAQVSSPVSEASHDENDSTLMTLSKAIKVPRVSVMCVSIIRKYIFPTSLSSIYYVDLRRHVCCSLSTMRRACIETNTQHYSPTVHMMSYSHYFSCRRRAQGRFSSPYSSVVKTSSINKKQKHVHHEPMAMVFSRECSRHPL